MAQTTDLHTSTEPMRAPAGAGFGDPGPLGLAGFALTTLVLSVYNAKLIGTGEGVVLGLALFYGGIVQLLAGMWEFAKGNTFGAVAFASYGGFWLSFWYLVAHVDLSTTKGNDATHGVGLYLLAWGIFTGYMFIASLRTTGAVAAVFAVLTLTFFALCIGAFGSIEGWTKVGGWLGIITAALAWYASFAGVTNSTFKRAVLPVFPRA